MTTTQPLRIEINGAVKTLTINDPACNPMSRQFMDQLKAQIEETETDENIRSVVLTTAGMDNFSVGMNLTQAVIDNRRSADSREGMRAFLEKRKPVFNQGREILYPRTRDVTRNG